VSATGDHGPARPIHPVFAFLLAAPVPLFLGAWLADWTYANSMEIQWSNFAAWLIVGAMVFTGLALLAALVGLVRARRGWRLLCFVLLLAAFILGLFDSFVHARDAWGIMPAAPILSAAATAVAALATLTGFSSLRARVVK
jgi:uncharacterized membrane protein